MFSFVSLYIDWVGFIIKRYTRLSSLTLYLLPFSSSHPYDLDPRTHNGLHALLTKAVATMLHVLLFVHAP
ncbi:hypothetical protein D3C75_1189930 [compost metagenome]